MSELQSDSSFPCSGHASQRKLTVALMICIAFMLIELIGGFISGSLAIMTDAAHLLSDAASLLISIVALAWSRKEPSPKYTYGYPRAEILGALLSVFLIWMMAAFLLLEAGQRLMNPQQVDTKVMVVVAGIGVLINISLGSILRDRHSTEPPELDSGIHTHAGHSRQNLNIRAALLHVFGDLIQSIGVLLAALIMRWRPGWTFIDPICTLAFTIIVVASTIYLVRDTFRILMQAAPSGIDLDRVREVILAMEGVKSVDELHIWSLSPGKHVLSAKIRCISYAGQAESIRQVMRSSFGISHATIEVHVGEK